MINIIVTITVSEENRPQVLPLLEALTTASQQELGNISYEFYLHPTDPMRLAIIEVWQNAEVLAEHEATKHFTTLLPQIEKLVGRHRHPEIRRRTDRLTQDAARYKNASRPDTYIPAERRSFSRTSLIPSERGRSFPNAARTTPPLPD